MTILIVLLAVALIIYFYREKQKKSELLLKKAQHLEHKYQRELRLNSHYFQKIMDLAKLVNDLIMLNQIKRLIEIDPNKYDRLSKNKHDVNALDKWLADSKDVKLVKFKEAKKIHSNLLKKIDEIWNLQRSYIPGYLEKSQGWKIQLDLDTVTGTFLSAEQFYRIVNEKKYISKKQIDVKKFQDESLKLIEEIDKDIIEINDRQFEIS